MREIMILLIIVCFCYIILISVSFSMSALSIVGGYMNSDGEMGFLEYGAAKAEYSACQAQHTFSLGGVFGAESGCWDPDGLNLVGGAPCPEGDSTDCRSGHCDCTWPSETGDSCFCRSTGDETDLKKPRGARCAPDDHAVCASGECHCGGALGWGLMDTNCKCT